jgi:PAS domain S-box-containing protein
LQINATALRMAGKDELQVLGLPFWETPWFSQGPKERERLRDAVVRAAQGQSSRFELALRSAGGEVLHVDFTMQPLRNAEGQVVWLVPQGIDITERKAAEGLLQRDREQQIILRGLMETILLGGGLEDTLARCLAQLLGISWLSILPKGGIFLLEEDGKTLRLAVSSNLAPEILSNCDRVPLGVCHCGRAASSCELQYAECVDGRHDISYPGMADHGHYSLPLLLAGKLQGVLVLYLPIGFQRDPVKEEFISTVTDILSSFLGRKQDEQALRDSEDLTRAVMDSLGSGIAVLDGDGGIIRVNKTWRDFSRDNEGDEALSGGIGLNYLEVARQAAEMAEEGAQEALDGMLDVMAGKREIFSVEYPCHAPDQERWFQLQVTRLGGATKGLVTSQINITQRKLAERELERYQQHLEEIVAERTGALGAAEEQVRLILESTADGLFGIDSNGMFSFVNPAACVMLGYAAEALIGRPVHRTIHHSHQQGDPYPEEECPMVTTLREGTIIRVGSEVFWRADGGSLPVAYASHPMIRNGEIVGAVVNFTDITVLLETDAARERALREAERLARIRSEFLANMSHEIRTPLNAVLGLAQVGLRESEKRKAHETFSRILDSGQLLLGIVNDILDFSKIEAGRLVIEQAVFSPGEVIDQAVAMIADRAYAKGLDFQVEEAADLPWSCSGDSLRLAQVLVNLLSNAVKFTERGSVILRARREGDSLLFRVGDTGIGMSEEQIGRLFTPFEQADGSTTRRFGGTGLGLAISKRLVDMMGGTLSVASQIGSGTAFLVRLPLHLATGKAAAGIGWRVALAGFAAEEKDRLLGDMAAWGLVPAARAEDADILICEGGALSPDILDLARAALARDARVGIIQAPGKNLDTNDVWERARLIERPLRMRHLLSVWESGAKSLPTPPLGALRLQGISVLAAEDNEVNRLVLAEMLMTEGATLTCLENGREALDQLARAGAGTYDVLLTDIQMPVMDGYETARGAHALDPDLPVIGITAHAMAEERERCRAAGMVEHVAKPVDMDVLVAAILRHARSRSASTGAAEPLPAANPVPLPAAPAEPLSAASGTDVIDWAKLEARFRGKREFVDRLVNTAMSSHADSPAKLRALAEAGDFKDLAFIAHALKGAGGNLMAAELHELAARTEQSAKAGESQSRGLAEQLALAVERMLAAMAERIK